MLAKLHTYSLFGIDARKVEAECDISPASIPRTTIVGMADSAVKESIHRIERALVNSGYTRPVDRIVINLSPADFPKEAPSFDLPIALASWLRPASSHPKSSTTTPSWVSWLSMARHAPSAAFSQWRCRPRPMPAEASSFPSRT
jgi:hypothetical protein